MLSLCPHLRFIEDIAVTWDEKLDSTNLRAVDEEKRLCLSRKPFFCLNIREAEENSEVRRHLAS